MKRIILLLLLWFTMATGANSQILEKVLVINEGSFNNANSSITLFNPSNEQVGQNVFFNANGRPLGDIANFSGRVNDHVYVIVSNSDKIEVLNKDTYVSEAIIEFDDPNGGSPAAFAQVDENRLYATNLTGSILSIVDINTHTVTGTIEVGLNPAGITVSNGKAYVALSTFFGPSKHVAVVDIATDQLLYTVEVHDNPQVVRTDSDGFVWVLCTGDYGFGDLPESFGELHVIDPETDEVVDVIETGGHPFRFVVNEDDGLGYVINEGIQVVDLDARELQEELLTAVNYYSIAYWGGDEPRIFGGIAPNFSSAGTVHILNLDGTVEKSFTAGIAPSHFEFIYDAPPTGIDQWGIAGAYRLEQNYPNPFNPSTSIRFELSEPSHVRLEVYSVTGQRVAVLADGTLGAGTHQVTFDAGHLTSGVYLYRMTSGNTGKSQTRKMLLVK